MTTDDTQSPFKRTGFLLAAAAISVIVIMGVVFTIVQATKPETDPGTAPTQATAAPAQPSESASPAASPAAGDSVCGLTGSSLNGTLSKAPETQWNYSGTDSYPSSTTFGPAKVAPEGYRYCFQQSTEGAVFAAANAALQGSQPYSADWMKYVIAPGPGRETAIASTSGTSSNSGRLQIQGFRLLGYNGSTATVDIAMRFTADGKSEIASVITELSWHDGDWKLVVAGNGQPTHELELIPDIAGYVNWRE